MLISNLPTAGRSHPGAVRGGNADHFLVADLNRSITIHSSSLPVSDETRLVSGVAGQLLVVADGISGLPGHDIASQIGVGTLARYVLNVMPWFLSIDHHYDDDQERQLLTAMAEVEQAVQAQVDETPEFGGMGTTLTMAYLMWPRMNVVNVGDSRCYLLRNGSLHPITRDHTAAQDMVDAGAISSEQAAGSPLSKVLVRSVGQGLPSLRPDVRKLDLKPGDRVLVCTNGLTAQVPDETITSLLEAAPSPDDACDSLIDAANRQGGSDNVTVAVAFCLPPIERPTKPRPSSTSSSG